MSTEAKAYAAQELLRLATEYECMVAALAEQAADTQIKESRWHLTSLADTYRDCADRAKARAVELSG